MENHHVSDDDDSEEFSDRFVCCVCLDLLYKPIVLSCGHVSCFWCVHRSMSGEQLSHCPLCRHPYNYFPTICQLLHCVLIKLYPLAYKRRELQILELEERNGSFSPQLDVQGWSILGDSIRKESNANAEKTVSGSYNQNNGIAVSMPIDGGDYEGMENVTDQVKNSLLSQQCGGSSKPISVADVLCAACKELLYRPVVLNCGHVYCESCIVKQDDQKLRCQVCQCFHPLGFPKVCLDLQNFLDEQFPDELAHRSDVVRLKHVNPTTCESKPSSKTSKTAEKLFESYHRGVGCDYCGMYPIIGDRYQCRDCLNKMGFDLCNDCYNTSSKLPGRFNQQHTSEHQFKLIPCNNLCFSGRIINELRAHLAGRELPNPTFPSSENDEDDQDDSQPRMI